MLSKRELERRLEVAEDALRVFKRSSQTQMELMWALHERLKAVEEKVWAEK